MFPSEYPDTPELVTERRNVMTHLTGCVVRFLDAVRSDLGDATHERFKRAAFVDLPATAGALRAALSTLRQDGQFDSTPYWMAIDAIGFWRDSHQGSWSYMGPEERMRYLGFARLHASELNTWIDESRRLVATDASVDESPTTEAGRVTAERVRALRDRTETPMAEAKQALVAARGDMGAAARYLQLRGAAVGEGTTGSMHARGRILDTPELVANRDAVRAELGDLFARFLEWKRSELGEEAYSRLKGAAAEGTAVARRTLNQMMVELQRKPSPLFEAKPYWDMDAAFGSLADSVQGRWPYMDPLNRENSLRHAREWAADVETAIAAASQIEGAEPRDADRVHVERMRS